MKNDLAKAVIGEGVAKLEALKDEIARSAARAADIVQGAMSELAAVEEASRVGSSQAFLGASVMLVGLTRYDLSRRPKGSGTPHVSLAIDHSEIVEFHGDPEAVQALEGKYKAILLLYKAD